MSSLLSISSSSGSSCAPGSHLAVDGVSALAGRRRILTDISFTVAAGERVCLLGENGAGKTTLLRILANVDTGLDTTAVSGTVTYPGRLGLYHQQNPFAEDETLHQVLTAATQHPDALRVAVEEAAAAVEAARDTRDADRAGQQLDDALQSAERHRTWQLENDKERILSGLGIADIDRDRTVTHLSGGERARLALAVVLLSEPETLLLDEPTNHLDEAGTATLLDVLHRWQGPVLLATHDRAFVDEAATRLDLQITATAAQHGLSLLTRNGADFNSSESALTVVDVPTQPSP